MTKVDIGYVVGCVFAGLFALGATITLIAGFVGWRQTRDNYHREGGLWMLAGVVVLLLTAGAFTWGAWPPFNMEYHSYRQTTGTVAEVQKRLVAGSEGGMSEFFAVRFSNSPQVYRCDDTRCSLLKPGEHVELWCIREWQQASTPGYRCNFGRSDSP